MKRWVYVLVPLTLLGSLIGWRLAGKRGEAAERTRQRQARAQTAPVVTVAVAEVRDIVRTFEGVGSVEAPLSVQIAPKVAGRIAFLQAREGDRVTTGQVLARIDSAEVEAEVRERQAASAKARITQIPANLAVNTEIRRQEAALASAQADDDQARESDVARQAAAAAAVTEAQGRIDSAAAQIASAEATIRRAQADLENARVRHDRAQRLAKEGAVAQQEADDARTLVSVRQGVVGEAVSARDAAKAARDSAVAQKQATEKQAQITRTQGRAAIAAARARVAQARATLEDARANRAQTPAYQQNLQALGAAVEATQAALRAAQARRADTVLRSPLTGVVTGRHMDPGAMTAPSQPILAVQAIRQVWVTVPVPEEVSRRTYVGQPARVTLDALPGRTFTGPITQVNPAADPQSRQFIVRVRLDNEKNLLKPGMFGRVTLVTERAEDAVVVPQEAVQQSKEGPAVVVVDANNVARRRPVRTGMTDANRVAIVGGLRKGEKVVTLSAAPVRDGQTVRLSRPALPATAAGPERGA